MIDNPEAVRFCNEKVRVAADLMSQLYFFLKGVKQEWEANGMDALLPADGGVVVDGSAADGRHEITGNDVWGLIYRVNDFIADYEANNNAKLNSVLAVAVNTQR